MKLNDFEEDCLKYYGKILTGNYKHYCVEWDFLPIDETCPEFEACNCGDKDERTIQRALV